ncbi:MAG TPA: hypothetical protein DEO32_00600 [Ruminococcaceae bacterium]|nr:hypothetical protein [Oscillospiraceae bacterium]
MPVYRIAQLNININPLYPQTAKRLEPFLSGSAKADFDASANYAEIAEYVSKQEPPCAEYLAEGAIILTKICKTVLSRFDGCFFHSSSLMMDGKAYVFTALSGTGKSTHTALWRKKFGGRVTMINDDKPLIRKIDGKYLVCSTPWMGKSEIGTNIDVPVKAIYVLERGTTNKAERVSVSRVFRQLLEATLLPENTEDMKKLLGLFDGLFSSVPLFLLSCNTDVQAAQVAYDAANKE